MNTTILPGVTRSCAISNNDRPSMKRKNKLKRESRLPRQDNSSAEEKEELFLRRLAIGHASLRILWDEDTLSDSLGICNCQTPLLNGYDLSNKKGVCPAVKIGAFPHVRPFHCRYPLPMSHQAIYCLFYTGTKEVRNEYGNDDGDRDAYHQDRRFSIC
jgi:hypothetical protein